MTMSSSVLYWPCTVFLIVLLTVVYWFPRRRLLAASLKIPGPLALPLVGNALSFLRKPTENFFYMMRLKKKYGNIIRIWLGSRLFIAIADPVDIQLVLGNAKVRNRDTSITKVLSKFLGNGLLVTRDAQWKLHRKLITPTFHFNVLDGYVAIFARKSVILLDKLKEMADGRTFDAYQYLALCTLDAICETVIGTNMDTQLKGESSLNNAVARSMELIHTRMTKPWLLSDWLYSMTRDGRAADQVKEEIDKFSDSVIAQKLHEYRTSSSHQQETKKITTFLDLLIESSESQGCVLSPQELRDEVTTLVVAGLDTTATTIACLMTLLGIHPNIQDQLIEEVDEIFGYDTRHPNSHDLIRMTFIERCLKETLRLFPVATLLAREVNEDILLSNGHTLPAGCTAVVLSYTVHRDSRNFPHPDSFSPDRWLPENSTGRHPYSYLPFSAGPRNCVGQKYAWLQMKSIVSTVFRRLKVTTQITMDDLKALELSLVVKSQCGYKIQIQDRLGRTG